MLPKKESLLAAPATGPILTRKARCKRRVSSTQKDPVYFLLSSHIGTASFTLTSLSLHRFVVSSCYTVYPHSHHHIYLSASFISRTQLPCTSPTLASLPEFASCSSARHPKPSPLANGRTNSLPGSQPR